MTIDFNKIKPNTDLIETKLGPMYVYKTDQDMYKVIRTYGEYCHAEIDIMKLFMEENSIYVDVSANIGYHVLAMHRDAKCTVVGFEPNPSHFIIAAENCKDLPIQLYNALVSSHKDVVKLSTLDGIGTFDAQSISIDLLNLPKFSVIKIGSDTNSMDVLKGAEQTISKYRPVILYKTEDLNWIDSYDFVDNYGYKQYWVNCLNTPVKRDTFKPKDSAVTIEGSVTNILAVPLEKPLVSNLMPVTKNESYEDCMKKIKSYVMAF
jgi:FkbM family methyltransferase